MMDRVEIAVAGAGLIGRAHINLIRNSDRCRLVAIIDPSPEARALAVEARVPIFDSLEELFAINKPDGVILATPNQLHVEQALLCIEQGVPALIEKPVAHSLSEGERLLQAAEAAEAKLLVGHHRAHSPIMARAKQIIDEGLLGDLVAINGSALFYKPDAYFDAGPWRRQPGGGPILLNLIHEIGNLRYLCGEISEVQAMASNVRRRYPVEDTVAINLRFTSGVLATFLLSDTAASPRSWEQTSQENPDYATYEDEDCYVIAGTEGSLSVPTMRLKHYTDRAQRSWWNAFECSTLELQRENPLRLQLSHFCAVIRGETEPLVSVRDGLQNLRVTEAISTAATTARPVKPASLQACG